MNRVAAAPTDSFHLLFGLAPADAGAVFVVIVVADLAKRHTSLLLLKNKAEFNGTSCRNDSGKVPKRATGVLKREGPQS
jgi:hypothetical protein